MNKHLHILARQRSGFTLIELSVSLAIMAVLMLGLSGAVMISAHAIPTTTETGIADQQAIDVMNQLRTDLANSSTIMYRSNGLGAKLTLTINPTGATGEPSTVVYGYTVSTKVLERKVDAGPSVTVLTNILSFSFSINQTASVANSAHAMVGVDKTIEAIFEMHALLPYKPGVL